MRLCDKSCTPCCDFCIHTFHEWIELPDGKVAKGGPLGCSLHKDLEHQEIAKACGFCNDFYCMNVKENL